MPGFNGVFSNGKKWSGKIENIKIPDRKYEINNGEGLLIEYDKIKNIIFEGTFINGERNGKGKEYINLLKFGSFGTVFNEVHNELSNMIFEGEYLNNKRNGEGKEYDNDILKFKGNYLNGEKNGYGKNMIKMEKYCSKVNLLKDIKKREKNLLMKN